MVYTLRFFLNAVCFIILTYLVPVLLTFYIQCVLKLKKNNSGAKRVKAAPPPQYQISRKTFVWEPRSCIHDGHGEVNTQLSELCERTQ